ncbi:hypothetical protein ACFFMM_12260 [Micromonospora chaiyaphumensis]|uniref:Uncharacterized protein n=1 Tax=Micromonospora chaiyaphumensis TaxID=307119 RepID=A0A1C4WE56_9ACTN|nr:hypothetical protein [Micromonospora chaiyaphumensis]SCE94470.1 hypothetical protein GA0070214_103483 [Micromonospora chaiyaphumensis]
MSSLPRKPGATAATAALGRTALTATGTAAAPLGAATVTGA